MLYRKKEKKIKGSRSLSWQKPLRSRSEILMGMNPKKNQNDKIYEHSPIYIIMAAITVWSSYLIIPSTPTDRRDLLLFSDKRDWFEGCSIAWFLITKWLGFWQSACTIKVLLFGDELQIMRAELGNMGFLHVGFLLGCLRWRLLAHLYSYK